MLSTLAFIYKAPELQVEMKFVWSLKTHNEGNVEHCGASMSKQCTAALNGYVANALHAL